MSSKTEKRSIEKLLEETTIGEILPSNPKTITISSRSTIAQAIKILSDNNILSAPVEVEGETDVNKKFLGFIDMFDILSYVILIYTEDKTSVDGTQLHLWCQNLTTLTARGKEFAGHSIVDCIDMSKIDPFVTVNINSKLPNLVYLFTKGPHRAAVVDNNSNIVGIVTQSTILNFLGMNIGHYGKIAQSKVEDIGFLKNVQKLSSESRAIHGFWTLIHLKISGLAIVDHQGSIVGNLSISDLKGLSQENFGDLLLPVSEYLKKTNRTHSPVTVKENTTIETVVLKLALFRVHRVWVVDEYDRPIGLISMTDIMRLLDLRIYIDQTEPLWEKELNRK